VSSIIVPAWKQLALRLSDLTVRLRHHEWRRVQEAIGNQPAGYFDAEEYAQVQQCVREEAVRLREACDEMLAELPALPAPVEKSAGYVTPEWRTGA
jgi:hypothetical protein